MMPFRTFPLVVVLLLSGALLCTGCSTPAGQNATGLAGAPGLQPYSDPVHLFTLEKPPSWVVSVGDAIEVRAPDTNGARVVLRPLFLSGSYRTANAGTVANYLVGQEAQRTTGFTVSSARQARDGSMLELVAAYDRGGVPMNGVFTVFVRSPYGIYSAYEAPRSTFTRDEPVMRAIAASFSQLPVPATGTPVTGGIGPLRPRQLSGGVSMKVPDGWNVQVMPYCAGLIAADPQNTRGVVFLNGLHMEPGTTLPPGITPEEYLTGYLSRDFSTVSDVRILSHEETDLSALQGGSTTVRAMRIAFSNSGNPTTGLFVVGTSQAGGGYYTTVNYLWGVYAPATDWERDAPVLLESFLSIDYSQATLEECRRLLSASWRAVSRPAGSGGSGGNDDREQQLKDWYARQENEDIFMEKFEDYILNRDRVYNPETNEVYHVDQNFYQYYDTHREQFRQQDLQPLTDTQFRSLVPLDGSLHIQPNV